MAEKGNFLEKLDESSLSESLIEERRLPVNGIVLRRLLWLHKNDKLLPTKEMCSVLFHTELKKIWLRAGIPMQLDQNCIRMLGRLWNNYLLLKKFTRNNISRNSRIPSFFHKRKQLLDFAPKNVADLLRSRNKYWREDLTFLEGQRLIPQIGTMIGYSQVQSGSSSVESETALPDTNKANKSTQYSERSSESDLDITPSE